MFEWDENKRCCNLEKHKLDFVAACLLFDGRSTITGTSDNLEESRHVTTGMLDDGKFYTVVWTWRDIARRIISFRRARDVEERTYRQIHG